MCMYILRNLFLQRQLQYVSRNEPMLMLSIGNVISVIYIRNSFGLGGTIHVYGCEQHMSYITTFCSSLEDLRTCSLHILKIFEK